MTKSITFLIENLRQQESQEPGSTAEEEFLAVCSKDVVILDYLITCKQLLEMIEKEVRATGSENYEKFAKKSRIE